MRLRTLVVPTLTALTGALVIGTVWADIPDSVTGEITGCYSRDGGVLRVIDAEAPGPPDCRAAERKLVWSQTGPQGPSGDPAILRSGSTTDHTENPMPIAATAVDSMSVTIPASTSARIAVVTVFVSGITSSNSNRRFGIYLDGALQFPAEGIGSQSQYNDTIIPTNGWSWTATAAIPILGDNLPHTIDVRGQAKDDQNSTTYKNRSLGVILG